MIGNQRKQKAIEEDGENKPWRPMPAKRLTQTQANYFLIAAHIAALMSSLYIGGLKQCIALILLDYWYNDLEGGDKSWFLRSFINACGFSCYASGATEIASGYPGFPLNDTANQWFLIIGMIVFSTIQSMDMYDQVGDRLRGRRTIPLILGDSAARWTLAIPVAIWSFFCPFFWRLPVGGYLGSALFGGVIIYRTLNKRTTKDDRMTFSMWNLWMVVLYLSPLFKRMEGLDNPTGIPETRLFGYI